MNIDLLGTAGPHGWPQPDCRCASCSALRATGTHISPTRFLVDGVSPDGCPTVPVSGGYDIESPSGEHLLLAAGPGQRPEPVPGRRYDAVLLDLAGDPTHLGRLRHAGAVTPATTVHAVHVDHRLRSPAELERRLRWWRRPPQGPYRTLLLGGSRSGKSAEAELRLAAESSVMYVATAADRPGDAEWAARIAAHRDRRPPWWRTAETTDLPEVLASTSGAVLIDGLGTWLAAVMDATGAWENPAAMTGPIERLVESWRTTSAHVIAVTDEVGLSLVPTTRAGRRFSDLLGRVNQSLAAESEEAALVVAGRVVELP